MPLWWKWNNVLNRAQEMNLFGSIHAACACCAKKNNSKCQLSTSIYPQQSASAAKQNTKRIAITLLMFCDVMNVMLSTCLMPKLVLQTRDWIQSCKNLGKWGPFTCLFLRNLFSSIVKTSWHSYSLKCNEFICHGKVVSRMTLLLGHLGSKGRLNSGFWVFDWGTIRYDCIPT